MRIPLFAAIGAVWLTGTGASLATPINAAAIAEAAEQLNITESVHCRPFRHWHRWGYSRGCGRVYINEGVRVRTRIGVRSRDGFRGDGRSGVTVRGEGRGSFRGGATIRGGANAPSETSRRQSGGGGGATSGGGQGGNIKAAPSGGGAGGGLPGTAGASGTKQ
jgi:hypothetical protein